MRRNKKSRESGSKSILKGLLLIALFPIILSIWIVKKLGMAKSTNNANSPESPKSPKSTIITVAGLVFIACICIAAGGTKNSTDSSGNKKAAVANSTAQELLVASTEQIEPNAPDDIEQSAVSLDGDEGDEKLESTTSAEAEAAEKERLEQEKAEHEKLEQEKLEKERLEKEKAEQEKKEKEKAEQARKEQERLEKEKAGQKKQEQEQAANEQIEQQTRSQNGGGNDGGSNFNTYDNAEQQNTTEQWVLNTNPDRMKIHYPSCKDVKKIAPQNYATSSASLDDLINQGYTRCGHCFK